MRGTKAMKSRSMCDSLTVYSPSKSFLRVLPFALSLFRERTLSVFSLSLFFSLLALSQTHTRILVPFIIHDLLAGRRLCLRRIRHSWLCVLEPSRLYVEKKGCSSRPSLIPRLPPRLFSLSSRQPLYHPSRLVH